MDSSENPLRKKLETEFNQSEWFQKFKALRTLLQTLKAEVPLTQLCDVKWDTSTDTLLIHCPNPEIRHALCEQSSTIDQIQGCATQVILRLTHYPDIIIRDNSDNPQFCENEDPKQDFL